MSKKEVKTVDGVTVYCEHTKLEKIVDVKPNPENPNEHTEEQIDRLGAIIIKNGWRNPITVSNRSGLIVKGHGRYFAAIRTGLTEAPIDYQDYETDDDEIADLIADNVIAEFSKVDRDKARDMLKKMETDNFDPDRFGFSFDEFDAIIKGGGGGRDPSGAGRQGTAEVQFSEELLLEHNYIVLYFDNSFDWQVAVDKFGLEKARDLIPRKAQPVGIGRVLNGSKWLDKIK